jgi:hypothetical protein
MSAPSFYRERDEDAMMPEKGIGIGFFVTADSKGL